LTINKKHWYDGIFYDKIIAPNQDGAFKIAKGIMKEQSSVLDVGCGTGRLAFKLADKCKYIDGIDLSENNIKVAKRNLQRTPSENISFFHSDAETFLSVNKTHYDYAVLSYVIHEIDEHDRIPLLKLLAEKAKQIIVIDFLVPRPEGYLNTINGMVEFAAGRDHYNNFKTYIFNDGLHGLEKLSGLKITKDISKAPKTAHIVVFENR
jgi:methylase of polypeptide subunit release factors